MQVFKMSKKPTVLLICKIFFFSFKWAGYGIGGLYSFTFGSWTSSFSFSTLGFFTNVEDSCRYDEGCDPSLFDVSYKVEYLGPW